MGTTSTARRTTVGLLLALLVGLLSSVGTSTVLAPSAHAAEKGRVVGEVLVPGNVKLKVRWFDKNWNFLGSRKVNGVSALHTELMKKTVFHDLHRMYPDKIINQTNGVTPRRWILECNRGLAALISEHIGEDWITDLEQLSKLEPQATDAKFQKRYMAITLSHA